MSRRSSASVFGGIGSPSGVRKLSRRPAALFSLGLNPRMPSRISAAFIRLTIRLCSPTRLSRSRLGRLASSSFNVGIATNLAVITLAAQPAEKSTFEQLGVETVGLRSPMLARHRHTRGVNDVGLNAARLEPACQPEAVTAGLEGNDNAFDPASCFLRFLPPSMQQPQQCALIDRQLLQRLTLDARHDTGNEPARQAHLDDRNQCAGWLKGDGGPTQVVQRLHGQLHRFTANDGCNIHAAAPIASSIMGFEDEVEQSLPRPYRWLIGRSKRTYGLTSSIVPRGTSFHRWVDLRFSLI